METSIHKCQICEIEKSKYKCPKCLLKYCCLKCYKVHQENKCEYKNIKPIFKMDPSKNTNENLDCAEDEVAIDKLKELYKNNELKEMINDEQLKTIITNIDGSNNSNMDIEKAMKNKLFKQFSNKCLEIINPDIYYKEVEDDE